MLYVYVTKTKNVIKIICYCESGAQFTNIVVRHVVRHVIKLEIWGKAQRESARHPKSNWGKLGGG